MTNDFLKKLKPVQMKVLTKLASFSANVFNLVILNKKNTAKKRVIPFYLRTK